MRYFYFICDTETTIIIVDENSDYVKLFPSSHRLQYSLSKITWTDHHAHIKRLGIMEQNKTIFEICENQFKKFKEQGITPINLDW